MNKDEFIEKWQKEMEETFNWINNEKDDVKRLVFISRHTAISDMLEDVQKIKM